VPILTGNSAVRITGFVYVVRSGKGPWKVAGLSSWLRGLPVPGGQPNIVWDTQGRLLKIEQNGWQISYSRYLVQSDLQLPEKLRMQRDSLQVKFIIDVWQTS
jgi:outer membrane lipoprotein LolB